MKNRSGFTFVEVMVVAAIFSVVALALTGVLSNGLSIWDRVEKIVMEEDVSIFFDKFTTSVKNTIDCEGIDFKGTGSIISIPTFIVSGDGAYLPGRVTYSFDRNRRAISRRTEDYSQIVRGKHSPKRIMASDVVSAEFSYYICDREEDTYVWLNKWEKGIPSAVRLRLMVKIGDKLSQYVKTINVPVAKIEPLEV